MLRDNSVLRRLSEGPQVEAWLSRWAELNPGEHQRLMQPLPEIIHLQLKRGLSRDELSWMFTLESSSRRDVKDELHPLTSAAIAAIISVPQIEDPQLGWTIAAARPENHLLSMAGELRAVHLPGDLRRLDLALAGAATLNLSPVDVAALAWLLELPRPRRGRTSKGRTLQHVRLLLEEAVQRDLWEELLPGSCMASASKFAAESLANHLEVIPGANRGEPLSWAELIWDPSKEKLPRNVEIEEDDPAAERLLELLGQLAQVELPERGRRLTHSRQGEAALCWGPWPGSGTPWPLTMAMAVMPDQGENPGRSSSSAQVEIAFVRGAM